MKEWMIRNRALILVFLGGVILSGAIFGAVLWYQSTRGDIQKQWSIEELLELTDDEVASRYDELLENASPRGKRWLSKWAKYHEREGAESEEEKSRAIAAREKAAMESRARLEKNRKKSKSLQSSQALPGALVPFVKKGQYREDPPSSSPNHERFLELFPAKQFFHPQEPLFGFIEDYVNDIDEFLRAKECINPAMSLVTEDRRLESRFFDIVQGRSFVGDVYISGDSETKIPIEFEFNSDRYQGQDHIESKDGPGGDVYEKRNIPSDMINSVWRYNSCVGSVVLLSDHCPWNQNYQHEFKDLYYLSNSNRLLGNVYCKKASDTEWVRVGYIDSEDKDY
ncbi:MAG: hypothetical protein KDD52_00875 [Bdellovibrionales bacterium]|nr:hypothetical protein [Bdellovibrionales bacterium]